MSTTYVVVLIMFLLRNKKDISIFRMKKAPYLLLWSIQLEPTTAVFRQVRNSKMDLF